MGHSADYQAELQIRDLEYIAQILKEQANILNKTGAKALAKESYNQAEQLGIVITLLRRKRKERL
ncbi:hypothetical protein SAMN04490186_5859 [Pseudomonas grimontii]|uniref:Uncharacterized protein n=1 Tax=Pseudomonas grimontii TaxID=129847 RepID=A0A1H1IKZ1_9PSED|nr:hypothetical protein [Pseudomonas grimontii]TWR64410.1 hypothetical protein FIV39_19695 [Pseudomonas grimontii]SDR38387.1 hypothetical protein SAMN04490186_5859 [Pseudomonas grimontii]